MKKIPKGDEMKKITTNEEIKKINEIKTHLDSLKPETCVDSKKTQEILKNYHSELCKISEDLEYKLKMHNTTKILDEGFGKLINSTKKKQENIDKILSILSEYKNDLEKDLHKGYFTLLAKNITNEKINAIDTMIKKLNEGGDTDKGNILEAFSGNPADNTEVNDFINTLKKHRNYLSPLFAPIATLFGKSIETKGEN